MAKRKLEDLNLLDDFMFGKMVTYPEIGEKFSRRMLWFIFKKQFGQLKIVPQKVYYGDDTDKHGTRLDVYLEETDTDAPADATIYDVEPDKNDGKDDIASLPKRVRFYHAKIDSGSLQSGDSYLLLKRVIVIMILPYDPLGGNRMVYTIRSKCEELPNLPYDDGAMTLFLYTKGDPDKGQEELQEFLHYMEETKSANAVNSGLKEIQHMVDTVKKDKEVSLEYMKFHELEERLLNQGRKEGHEEGFKEGQAKEQANTERERQRANIERQRANSERQRADSEHQRAEAAEYAVVKANRELEVLREELRIYKEKNNSL